MADQTSLCHTLRLVQELLQLPAAIRDLGLALAPVIESAQLLLEQKTVMASVAHQPHAGFINANEAVLILNAQMKEKKRRGRRQRKGRKRNKEKRQKSKQSKSEGESWKGS